MVGVDMQRRHISGGTVLRAGQLHRPPLPGRRPLPHAIGGFVPTSRVTDALCRPSLSNTGVFYGKFLTRFPAFSRAELATR